MIFGRFWPKIWQKRGSKNAKVYGPFFEKCPKNTLFLAKNHRVTPMISFKKGVFLGYLDPFFGHLPNIYIKKGSKKDSNLGPFWPISAPFLPFLREYKRKNGKKGPDFGAISGPLRPLLGPFWLFFPLLRFYGLKKGSFWRHFFKLRSVIAKNPLVQIWCPNCCSVNIKEVMSISLFLTFFDAVEAKKTAKKC